MHLFGNVRLPPCADVFDIAIALVKMDNVAILGILQRATKVNLQLHILIIGS